MCAPVIDDYDTSVTATAADAAAAGDAGDERRKVFCFLCSSCKWFDILRPAKQDENPFEVRISARNRNLLCDMRYTMTLDFVQ